MSDFDKEPDISDFTSLPVNSGGSASDAGLQASSPIVEGTSLDTSWKNKRVSINSNSYIDAQSGEQRKDREMVNARRKIAAIMEEDQAGIMAEFGLPQLANKVASDMYTKAYMNQPNEASMMMEDDYIQMPPKQQSGAWSVEKTSATLKSGKQIPVWMVVETTTGAQIKTPFRIVAPAKRAAHILNENGSNTKDPRFRQLMGAYDKHVDLMKQLRSVRKQINEGQDRTGRLQALESQLESVNLILGI